MKHPDIQIHRKLANQLLHLAQISPNEEICGLISSQDGRIKRCYPIINSAEQPQHFFLLETKEQITAMTKMRDQGEALFAIYHSHPTAPAQPSSYDLALSSYPEVLHFIISLNTKGILEMRCFKINGNKAYEIPLVMGDDLTIFNAVNNA